MTVNSYSPSLTSQPILGWLCPLQCCLHECKGIVDVQSIALHSMLTSSKSCIKTRESTRSHALMLLLLLLLLSLLHLEVCSCHEVCSLSNAVKPQKVLACRAVCPLWRLTTQATSTSSTGINKTGPQTPSAPDEGVAAEHVLNDIRSTRIFTLEGTGVGIVEVATSFELEAHPRSRFGRPQCQSAAACGAPHGPPCESLRCRHLTCLGNSQPVPAMQRRHEQQRHHKHRPQLANIFASIYAVGMVRYDYNSADIAAHVGSLTSRLQMMACLARGSHWSQSAMHFCSTACF
jgi:hypothetical protein